MRLQPCLAGLIESIHNAAAKGWSEQKARDGVAVAIRQQRAALREAQRPASLRNGVERMASTEGALTLMPHESRWTFANTEMFTLSEAIEFLASLPTAQEVFANIGPDVAGCMPNVSRAARWLGDFAELWTQTRRSQNGLARVAVMNGSLGLV
jgi:hypothetical protein